MRMVHIITGRYSSGSILAFQNRNDAVKTVCALHGVDASEASAYIKPIPFMGDKERYLDPRDVDTITELIADSVQRGYKMACEDFQKAVSDETNNHAM